MEPVNYKKKYILGVITGLAELAVYFLLCFFYNNFVDGVMHILFCFVLGLAWNLKYISRYKKRYPEAKYSDYRIPFAEPGCPEINICVFNIYKWILITSVGGIIGSFISNTK